MSYIRFRDGEWSDMESVYLYGHVNGGLSMQSHGIHYDKEPFIEAVMQVMARGDFSQEELNRMHGHLLDEIPDHEESLDKRMAEQMPDFRDPEELDEIFSSDSNAE